MQKYRQAYPLVLHHLVGSANRTMELVEVVEVVLKSQALAASAAWIALEQPALTPALIQKDYGCHLGLVQIAMLVRRQPAHRQHAAQRSMHDSEHRYRRALARLVWIAPVLVPIPAQALPLALAHLGPAGVRWAHQTVEMILRHNHLARSQTDQPMAVFRRQRQHY